MKIILLLVAMIPTAECLNRWEKARRFFNPESEFITLVPKPTASFKIVATDGSQNISSTKSSCYEIFVPTSEFQGAEFYGEIWPKANNKKGKK